MLLYHTVQYGRTQLVYAFSPNPFPFAEVGLPCETEYNAEASKSTSIVLLKSCDYSTQSIYKLQKLQHKDSSFCHKTLSLLVGFGHETGRQQN